jgi:hypothetical protein
MSPTQVLETRPTVSIAKSLMRVREGLANAGAGGSANGGKSKAVRANNDSDCGQSQEILPALFVVYATPNRLN